MRLCHSNGIFTVQLGSLNNGEDYDVDLNMRGKTTFKESLRWLENSMCHIDIEGGLAHAATALGTKCIVLFGPTNKAFFGYPQNINLNAASECVNCWWKRQDWMEKCMNSDHVCMSHRPEDVFSVLSVLLASRASFSSAL